MSPEAIGQQALEEYDANRDGLISGEELDRCPALKNSMEVLDRNKDGKLSADEIAERIREYQNLKTALLTVRCQVTLNNRALPGARVTFVPEKFMGSAVKPASGLTDASGTAILETAGMSGANLGFYKIEVSLKDGVGNETVPPRYNSQTVLGQEVGPGLPTLKGLVKLALTSE
jgi:hypothetical protein